ncbi:MAG: amidohydrolase family protein, partial [Desulfatiglandales bacterium]
MEEKERLKRLILAAQGRLECDLVLKNGFVLDVYTGDILLGDVGIIEGRIAGVGKNYRGKEELDLSGMFLSPGFIDAHMHVESTMLIPSRLSKYLLLHGTTTLITDPHEIANVLGLEGIMAMIEDGAKGSIDYFFTAPSCVPPTQNETSGAIIGIEELKILSKHEKVVGLSEVMDFLSVLRGDEEVLEKLLLFGSRHGHAPLLRGPELMGYVAAGIDSDHETVSYKEGLHKLRAGVFLMIRNGSSAKNLEELLPLVDKNSLFRCCLVTDDLCPKDILDFGHLDGLLKRSMELGLDPISAYRLVTICPASYLGFRDRGAVSPGK